jgi:membrane-bound lytic murein transglycosylase A
VSRARGVAAAAFALLLSSCVAGPKPISAPSVPVPASPTDSTKAPPATAAALGIAPGRPLADLPRAAEALAAFRISCPALLARTDRSGLTRAADWKPACDAARQWSGDAAAFFRNQFESVSVGPADAFATGYYEPEIAGSRTRAPGYETPVYRRPADLIEADLGLFSDAWKGKKIRGRIDGKSFVPYADRAAIEDGALTGRGLEIAWAADPLELFFLEVQGSGRLRLPDGGVMRIGYDSQNGRDYVGIGKLMRERGLLGPGQTSMQGIMAWIRAHPAEGRAIMRENKSYIFFRELTGAGPLGAMGVPVAGQTSVAADPAFVPLGAPVLLAMDRPEASGLWVAQDTGGAIRGANRFDTFWGAGDRARTIAGGMSAHGKAWLLLPRGTLARLASGAQRP